MYLAFKWLIFMAVAMWVTLCFIDIYVNKEIYRAGSKVKNTQISYENMTLKDGRNYTKAKSKFHRMKDHRGGGIAFLHYITFFAGALAVAAFNRKTEIIIYTKKIISKADIRAAWEYLQNHFMNKATAKTFGVTMLKNLQLIWENFTKLNLPWIFKFRRAQNRNNIHLLLMKLKEIGEERNNMGQLLLASVHENKHIRLQYQLEVLAKNRVLRQVEEIHKQMKENRSRYITFQQMYLVTHQENTFLKARLKKLAKDKETAERNLMTLVNEIYQTKNGGLRSFCSQFIVQNKNRIINDDVRTEIQNFLLSRATASTSKWQISESMVEPVFKTSKLDNCAVPHKQLEDESLVPFMEEQEHYEPEPKLRGLPGECVWTVKDKSGLIEKLYEYDFGYNFDNGDTIKRIREYSVYYDKDCLIDFSSSKTVINEVAGDTNTEIYRHPHDSLTFPSNHRFLTGSQAFQRFLQDNTNIIAPVSTNHHLMYA